MKNKERKGITLIALVITIIILLIISGIAIAMLSGENGLLEKIRQAKKNTHTIRNARTIIISTK